MLHSIVDPALTQTLTVAGDLIERTSSTRQVQQIVQLSLAPVFMLAAIGAFLNVMNARLFWLIEKIERIERAIDRGAGKLRRLELPALRQRRSYAQWAINLSTGAALVICLVVAFLFVSAYIQPRIGTLVAGAWIVAVVLLSGALLVFLLETRLATNSARERRQISQEIREREETSD
ncbi:DUF2721 domain-containing protein [Altererythrobacter aurantiacus]|uniref:DUF2721 domain-containing protein n=1 Tax=Parapontixanthobacter aurantiacus TaxID=1463599 RepID=A0A844Z7I6_9SPHN|nr:DUF2721 domain-containing protein [Parapontixanthobacter aurantiacus]MXO84581.1 DUF2721 domain-containing protein [Parapontixanthobacter aurantiacus]